MQQMKLGPGDPVTLVGVHVRRTDYINFLKNRSKSHVPDRAYYVGAMNLLRGRLGGMGRPPPVFVVSSDDLPWCRAQLGTFSDVTFVHHDQQVPKKRTMIVCGEFKYFTNGQNKAAIALPVQVLAKKLHYEISTLSIKSIFLNGLIP